MVKRDVFAAVFEAERGGGGNLSTGEEQEMVRRLREELTSLRGEGGEGGSKQERGEV